MAEIREPAAMHGGWLGSVEGGAAMRGQSCSNVPALIRLMGHAGTPETPGTPETFAVGVAASPHGPAPRQPQPLPTDFPRSALSARTAPSVLRTLHRGWTCVLQEHRASSGGYSKHSSSSRTGGAGVMDACVVCSSAKMQPLPGKGR